MNKKQIKEIVEEYCDKKVKTLDIVNDPYIKDCVALRAKFANDDIVYFIYDVRQGKDSLEEAEFTTWPPSASMYGCKIENMLMTVY